MQNDPTSATPPNGDADALPTDAPNHLPAQASGARQIGRYQIGSELPGGERLCRDRLLDRTVRVRTTDAALADDLEREARFVARLEHAGIPAVHDVVRGDGGALMVMRNVEGITLSSAIEDARNGLVRTELSGPVPVLRMLAKVCDALSAAHARGVAHRAVRTDVIVVGLHGEVVLGNWRAAMVAHERPATLRYVADLQPTQSHDLDDLHTDIRAVGRCLYEALTLEAYPKDAADPAAALASEVAQGLPPRASAVIRRAVGSDRVNGYRSTAELRVDLDRAAAEIETSFQQPRLTASRPTSRRAWLAACLGLVLGGLAVGVYQLLPRAPKETGWGQPIALERFDDANWRDRWLPDGDEQWELRQGRLVSTAPARALLVYRQRLTPPIAIEYTGQILPGERACDLSVWWSEREGVLTDPAKFADGARNWQIQAGAYENQFCAIFRNPGEQRMAYNALQLKPGQDYRFRVEIDGEYMSMAIDGVEVTRYRDRFPTTSGYLALYGYFPGKAFDDVAVWQKNRTGMVPATAMGDALLGFGHFADAATAYARVAEGDSGESQRALFRKGLAERRAGRNDLSRETWAQLTDPDLSQAADALRLDDLFTTGQHDLFLERVQSIWRRHPAGHDEVRQQWQQAMVRLSANPATEPALVERYLAVRDMLFRDDPTSAYEATTGLAFLQRYEDILRYYPNERRANAYALLALGRLEEAEKSPNAVPADRILVRMMRGDYAGVLQSSDLRTYQRAFIQCKLGRASEVVDGEHRVHPAMLYLGRAEEVLAYRPLSPVMLREALLALGRFEQAAGPGVPDVPGSGGSWIAALLLGRIEEAEALRGGQAMPWARLMRAVEAGDRTAVDKLRPQVAWAKNLSTNSFWFDGLVIGPMVDRLGGDAAAVQRSLERAEKEWGQVFARRAWFFARAALGKATDEEVLNMPVRSEAEAWLALAKALRAELADQPAEALAAYQAFAALPLHKRLLDSNTMDSQVETFVQWRLRALGR
ncbi:MAG TPA: hypothetical protein DCS97_06085 [Planctomycetes bacterium]|nr:hypothetical protein [Planctomycetota bacterium]